MLGIPIGIPTVWPTNLRAFTKTVRLFRSDSLGLACWEPPWKRGGNLKTLLMDMYDVGIPRDRGEDPEVRNIRN